MYQMYLFTATSKNKANLLLLCQKKKKHHTFGTEKPTSVNIGKLLLFAKSKA